MLVGGDSDDIDRHGLVGGARRIDRCGKHKRASRDKRLKGHGTFS
jgi:hypothetical protein